jgi:hypothetical protein
MKNTGRKNIGTRPIVGDDATDIEIICITFKSEVGGAASPLQKRSAVIIAVGLAAAVAIFSAIAFTSVNYRSSELISDAELQRKTQELPEVDAFLEKYPDANVQFNQDQQRRTIGYYTSIGSKPDYTLLLELVVNRVDGEAEEITLSCTKLGLDNNTQIIINENIEEEIRNEKCLHI